MKTRTELLAKANEQKHAGKKNLANFVLSLSSKSVNDLTENTWAIKAAVETVARSNINRMERIRNCASLECATGCNGTWLTMAKQVRRNNHIHEIVFAEIWEMLEKGRGKHQNVMLIGPRDRAKTFLIDHLRNVFWAFTNAADDQYAWVKTVENGVIFLNDFRWSKDW